MADDRPEPPAPIRDADGRFLRGPGRQKGSRNRFSASLAMAVLEDFADNRGRVLARLRYSHMQTYAAMVSRLLPRGADLLEDDDADALWPQLDLAEPADEPRPTAAINNALQRLESMARAHGLAPERERES